MIRVGAVFRPVGGLRSSGEWPRERARELYTSRRGGEPGGMSSRPAGTR